MLRKLAPRWWTARREPRVSGVAHGLALTLPAPFAERYFSRPYEPRSIEWLASHLAPGATAVDVGAHVGFVTCFMARAVGPAGRVAALEPWPANAAYVRKNLRLNGLRAELHQAAAGRTNGVRPLHVTGSSDSHGLYPHPFTETVRLEPVREVRLDDVVDRAELVKIDAEGAECDVLKGMERLLSLRPFLLVEWTPACQHNAGRGDDELVSALRERGYAMTVLDDFVGAVREVDDVLAAVRADRLPAGWHANLACVP